jgi:hypothetical protein
MITALDQGRALGVVERADALAVPGSVGAMLFTYREPVLRFRNADQQLLSAALRGLTDEESARTMGLTLPAVKKRWASVFDHVARGKPELLPGLEDGLDRQTRGPQKRHYLLAYLREHPEELRPVALRATTSV